MPLFKQHLTDAFSQHTRVLAEGVRCALFVGGGIRGVHEHRYITLAAGERQRESLTVRDDGVFLFFFHSPPV